MPNILYTGGRLQKLNYQMTLAIFVKMTTMEKQCNTYYLVVVHKN